MAMGQEKIVMNVKVKNLDVQSIHLYVIQATCHVKEGVPLNPVLAKIVFILYKILVLNLKGAFIQNLMLRNAVP